MLNEFKAFIMRGNVIDLAIGVVIGAAFAKIVDAFVAGIVMPPIGLATGSVRFSDAMVVLREGTPAGPYLSLKAATDAGATVLAYGSLIDAAFQFLVISGAVFLVVKALNKMHVQTAAEAAPPPPDVPILEEIRDLLKARPSV